MTFFILGYSQSHRQVWDSGLKCEGGWLIWSKRNSCFQIGQDVMAQEKDRELGHVQEFVFDKVANNLAEFLLSRGSGGTDNLDLPGD